MDIVEFLRARLDEDEAAANTGESGLGPGPRYAWPDYQTYDSAELGQAQAYINRFSPARVLREIEAKRRIITRLHSFLGANYREAVDEMLWDVFRAMAEPYADHPDYRPEWKP